ncbi:uncharacterized protein BDV14DRAFT_168558 [Aspergillus stella-maris]|uniref:uncharacterized protein n=1 Tax=Aspergillus stella-maris TaxID=1810926 RepID=UPI003CCDB0C0
MGQSLEDHQDQSGDSNIFTNNRNLIDKFGELMDSNDWNARYDRSMCPNCGQIPDKPVITSCLHMYCEECFCLLYTTAEETVDRAQSTGDSPRSKPACKKCDTVRAGGPGWLTSTAAGCVSFAPG